MTIIFNRFLKCFKSIIFLTFFGVVDMFANVDEEMAKEIAKNVGAKKPNAERGFDPAGVKPSKKAKSVKMGEFSQENTIFKPDTLKVGIYTDNNDDFDFKSLVNKIKDNKAKAEIIQGDLSDTKDGQMVKHRYETIHPVLEDALIVVVPEKPSKKFKKNIGEFVDETYKHYKPIWVIGNSEGILDKNQEKSDGVMVTKDLKEIDKFIENLAKQRFWNREGLYKI